MTNYINAEKLKELLYAKFKEFREKGYREDATYYYFSDGLDVALQLVETLQKEQDRMRYCIEYVNPKYPLLDNGELNIRHLRVPDEHGAEMALTLMLSLGAKIYKLYRGNVKEGKLAEWPTPMIVDTDDWYSIDWLHNILDCGHLL